MSACSICSDGSGKTPIAINCEDQEDNPFVLGTCTTIDCANTCNGTCIRDACDKSETVSIFDQPNSRHPKANSTNANPEKPDTSERPIQPGRRITTNFDNVQITLTGVGPLDKKAIAAFERTTAAWYNSVYLDKRARRLVERDFTDFSTTVTFRNQSVTDSDNTITYDQGVSFVPTSETSETEIAVTAQELLEKPFEDSTLSTEYAELLRESGDESFVKVQNTNIQKPIIPEGEVSLGEVPTQSPALTPVKETKADDSSGSNNIWSSWARFWEDWLSCLPCWFLSRTDICEFDTRHLVTLEMDLPWRITGTLMRTVLLMTEILEIDYSFDNEFPEVTGPFINNKTNEYVNNSCDICENSHTYFSDEDEVRCGTYA